MGCFGSKSINECNSPYFEEKKISDAIDQSLHLTRQNKNKQIKLLLLGAGESGKSTVLKQLKLLHKGGFIQQERSQYAKVIWTDAIQSMKILIVHAKKLGIPLDCDQENSFLLTYKKIILQSDTFGKSDSSSEDEKFLNDYVIKYFQDKTHSDRDGNSFLKKEDLYSDFKKEQNEYIDDSFTTDKKKKNTYTRYQIAEAISKLWNLDSGIKQCYDKSNNFQLDLNVKYYFNNIFKFADPEYLCSDLDILNGRVKTTSITETTFNINHFKFIVLDAGGQRSERKKWLHCFENITAVLFVLAISEYDQMLFENKNVNRMHESIALFESLCNSTWFSNTPFILFLNKIDIFGEKIDKSSILNFFPDYVGKNGDLEASIKFFEKKILLLNKSKKPIYVRRTCATDRNSMKFVLSAVTDLVIQQNLKISGII